MQPASIGVTPLGGQGSSKAVPTPRVQVEYAKAHRESRKGEDFACALLDEHGQLPAAFAVFDGHSGKRTAQLCSEMLCQRILQKGAPFTREKIRDVFWAVDEEIGTTPEVRDGATAQVLLVDHAANGGLAGTFAWCGDSTAIQVALPSGRIVYQTLNHMPYDPKEVSRLEHYRAVRVQVEANGVDTLHEPTSAEHIRTALQALDGAPLDEEIELLSRAFRRGVVICQTLPRRADVRRNVFVRRRSIEHDRNQVWVVATAEDRKTPGYYDLQMTRSICDWRGCDLVLPEPQLHQFDVPSGEHHRVVIASDGLWDVCTVQQAAEIARRSTTAQAAASSLLRLAEVEYLENRGHEQMDDDTTVLVVELNASGVQYAGGRRGSLGASNCVIG